MVKLWSKLWLIVRIVYEDCEDYQDCEDCEDTETELQNEKWPGWGRACAASRATENKLKTKIYLSTKLKFILRQNWNKFFDKTEI